ncbi:Protein cereblon-like [Papilio xuthus]|uniref:Protein cereblon-like n=1 Tax=Papilio xuthus TaxID=66420 RepID=A0A194QD24_PAPXU|nr:Protein cereblon-like [Papilio xuthus]
MRYVTGPLPEEAVALSFWVASNLTLSARDRHALFAVDDVLLRLRLELRFIGRVRPPAPPRPALRPPHRHTHAHFLLQKSALCCAACGAEIARRDDVLPMSSEGVHSNYTNSGRLSPVPRPHPTQTWPCFPSLRRRKIEEEVRMLGCNAGGYMHDIVTVSRARGVVPSGRRSAEFSWFPGYAWTIIVCGACRTHLGWQFDALSRSLRPEYFFGLCRNYVQPRADAEPDCV